MSLGVISFKGQGHWGQRSNFYISKTLGPISSKLGICIRIGPRIDPTGSKVKVTGIKVIFKNFVCLLSLNSSQALRPIVAKLGTHVGVGPRSVTEGYFFERSRSLGSKVKFLYL